jgi:hypothetical protein
VNRRWVLFFIAAILVCLAIFGVMRSHAPEEATLALVSGSYRLDKIYRSMEGPMSVQSGFQLVPGEKSRMRWITGLETQVLDAGDQKPISQEFFCHSNLTFAEHGRSPDEYNGELGGKTHLDWRLFTLVPGRLSIHLPPGFGVPVPNDAALDYLTMSLNLNMRDRVVNVRMQTNVHSVAADEPGAPTKALFRRALYVMERRSESADTGHACMADARTQHIGAGCAEISKVNLTAGKPGEDLMNQWSVPPGRHVYTMDVTPQLNLPFDTTIHYATIHVHPFARAMELRDLTTGTTVFRLNSQDWPDRIGVAHVDEFKSVEGVSIFRNHRYELSAEYDNTSGSNTDAMAILYLYLLEKDRI